MSKRGFIVSGIFLFAIVSSGAWIYARYSTATATEPVKSAPVLSVKVEQVSPQSFAKVYETTGDVVATKKVTIGATAEGPISFCPWREGDWVEAGKKIVEVDRPLYRAEVASAAAALAVARAKLQDFKAGSRPEEISQAQETVKKLQEAVAFSERDQERIRQLVDKGGLAAEALEKSSVGLVDLQSQLASARQKLSMLESGPTRTAIAVQEAQVKEAEAKLDLSRAKLAEGTIVAPFSGVVTKVYAREGDLASLKSPLIELAEPTSFLLRFAMPESHAGAKALSPGGSCNSCPILVTLDAYPGKSYQAEVVRIFPEIDRQTRHRLVEARILDKVNLAPGMFARIKVSVESVHEALTVPTEAIITTLSGDKVVLIVKEGKAMRAKISTGIVQGDRTQIVSGLQAGDQVIVLGQKSLKEGAPVKISGEGKLASGERKKDGSPKSEAKGPAPEGGNKE